MQSGVAAPGDAHARTGLRARGDAHVERIDARHAAFAAAIAAHRAQLSGAAAARAGDLKAHLAADLRHVPGAAARGADFFVARCDAGAVADVANVEPREAQFLDSAVHGLGKGDVDLDIRDRCPARAPVAACAALRAAEKLAEEIAETGPAACSGAGAAAKIESAEIEVNVLRACRHRNRRAGRRTPPGPGTLNPNWSYIWRFLVSERTS